MAGVNYTAHWWVNLLHRLPHFSLRWKPTSGQFRPKDPNCQRVLLLGGRCAGLPLPEPPLPAPLLLAALPAARERGAPGHRLLLHRLVRGHRHAGVQRRHRRGFLWRRGDQRRRPLGHLLAPPRQLHGGGGAGPHVGHRGCPEPHGGAMMP